MQFVVGERVIWHTRRLLNGHYLSRTHEIAAEVAHDGSLRVRIRIAYADGHTALRWVKPVNLRRTTPEQCGEPYPD
jgi:hypothetical protein